ncbi:MAG: hypothetical protein IJ635_04325 [Bacteroidaceae bacterium]|nr:hypothetical protein [Bacteroidaceae bacterium]
MKTFKNLSALAAVALALWGTGGLTSCVDDDTNYAYPSEEELAGYRIEIDTTGIYLAQLQTFSTWYVDSIYTFQIPGVRYAYPEHLAYRWLVIDNPYTAIEVGNTTSYPPADTICRTKDLYYKCDLPAGMHRIYFQAEDTVYGIKETVQINFGNYFNVNASGSIPNGVYALELNQDGLVDIDAFGTVDALIFGDYHERNLWTRYNADDPIRGEPVTLFMSTGTGYNPLWYYIATTEELRRVSPVGLATMDKNEELFYNVPDRIHPEAFANVNSADFLINDGKFYCLYSPNEANRKFPVALPGDYDLYPYLPYGTRSNYYGVEGAINSFQCVFDKKNRGLRPYFSRGTALSQFLPASADSPFNYTDIGTGSELLYYGQGNSGDAILITREADGNTYLNIVYFFNAVDNGNLCTQRTRLNGMLAEIEQAEHYVYSIGSAIFYTVGNKVYSWAYTSGRTAANLLETFPADEQITCISTLPTGGWPTGGHVVYVATWNETTHTGKVYHALFDPTSGGYQTSDFAPGQEGMTLVDDQFGKVFAFEYSTHTTLY